MCDSSIPSDAAIRRVWHAARFRNFDARVNPPPHASGYLGWHYSEFAIDRLLYLNTHLLHIESKAIAP